MADDAKISNDKAKVWQLRFWLIILFVISVLVIGLLNIIPVSSTQVLLELEVEEFVLEGSDEFKMVGIEADYVSIAFLDTLRILAQQYLIGNEENSLTPFRNSDPFAPLELLPRSDIWNVSISSEYLSCYLQVYSNSTLRFFSKSPSDGDFRVELLTGHISGYVNTGNDAVFHCNNCALGDNAGMAFVRIQHPWEEIKFRSREGKLQMRASNSTNINAIVIKNIGADSLDFVKDLDKESTIISGTIIFPELDGVSETLTEGDYLTICPKDSLRIRRLKINESINLSVQGEVTEIKTGIPGYMYSRMPTWLEWISTNRKTQFLMSSIIGLMTVILAILYKLKFLEK